MQPWLMITATNLLNGDERAAFPARCRNYTNNTSQQKAPEIISGCEYYAREYLTIFVVCSHKLVYGIASINTKIR